MESRASINLLELIHNTLTTTADQSLFGRVSSIQYLDQAPVPLTTDEMHTVSGEIIRNAKQEVLLAFYKFSATSDGGRKIISALNDLKARAERDQQTIQVYILINDRSKLAETFYKPNKPTGLEQLTSSEYVKITTVPHRTMAFGTLHSKLMIIDSSIAMVRGGDPQPGNDFSNHNIETASLIRGSLVSVIRNDYVDVWNACTVHQLEHVDAPAENEAARSQAVPCMYISKRANGNPIRHLYSESPYKLALLLAIENAVNNIDIMTSNINDPAICTALANACQRGVTVNIMTGKYHNDTTEKYWGGTNLSGISGLVRQIPKEYFSLLNVRWNTNNENQLVLPGEKYTVHAKYACIDKRYILTGSSPLDKQAMYYSREADIIFDDTETAQKYDTKLFAKKFAAGKDYFDDLYLVLYDQIEAQTQRIENSVNDNELRKTKAEGLRSALTHFTNDTRSPREKIFPLLELVIPLLQISTGSKPGNPDSYNAIYAIISEYGLAEQIAYIAERQLDDALSNAPCSSSSGLGRR